MSLTNKTKIQFSGNMLNSLTWWKPPKTLPHVVSLTHMPAIYHPLTDWQTGKLIHPPIIACIQVHMDKESAPVTWEEVELNWMENYGYGLGRGGSFFSHWLPLSLPLQIPRSRGVSVILIAHI